MKLHEKYLISEKAFIIRDKNKHMIAGFSDEHEIVQWADDVKDAQKFKTKNAAKKWAEEYAGAGYGFGKPYTIEEI